MYENINYYIRFGVYPHVQYGKHVSSATWDKKTNLWTVLTKDGSSYTANILISGRQCL